MNPIKFPLRHKQKPLFGFDIGHGSLKIVQLDTRSSKNIKLVGYGSIYFDPAAILEGEITNLETVAAAAFELFEKGITGAVTTRTIAASLPVSHSFSRVISLPIMNEKDILDAVKLEAEQYIPVSIEDLYIDYQLINTTAGGQDFLIAAAPKKVVDSYITLFKIIGLEPVVMEPSTLSVTRMVRRAESSEVPTLVIDCGSITTDLIIYNKQAVRVTGTIKFGGQAITRSLVDSLKLSDAQAEVVKSRYGLDASKKQADINQALEVPLKNLVSEIKKIIRYFEERAKDNQEKVGQILLLGGGANLPGLSTYLTDSLRIPSRLCSVWKNISLSGLQSSGDPDNSMYATATGLALIGPGEVSA